MDGNVLTIIGIGVVILLLVLPLISWGPRPRCPECRSRKIGVQKTHTGMRTTDSGAGGDSGGYTSVQMQYTVKYRCNECQTSWTTTETDTN